MDGRPAGLGFTTPTPPAALMCPLRTKLSSESPLDCGVELIECGGEALPPLLPLLLPPLPCMSFMSVVGSSVGGGGAFAARALQINRAAASSSRQLPMATPTPIPAFAAVLRLVSVGRGCVV